MYIEMSPAEQNEHDQRQRQIAELLRQLTALGAGHVSKLSARMVELSLQETQRGPTLAYIVPKEPDLVPSPLVWPTTDVQRVACPSLENAESTESLLPRAAAGDALRSRPHGDSTSPAQVNTRFYTFQRRILRPLTLAAGSIISRQRTRSLIERLSRATARSADSLTNRISGIKVYHCRDCGREVAYRSRPRTFVERYILPLLLMQSVRCAACFRRDYWLVLTSVHEHPRREDETSQHVNRNAA